MPCVEAATGHATLPNSCMNVSTNAPQFLRCVQHPAFPARRIKPIVQRLAEEHRALVLLAIDAEERTTERGDDRRAQVFRCRRQRKITRLIWRRVQAAPCSPSDLAAFSASSYSPARRACSGDFPSSRTFPFTKKDRGSASAAAETFKLSTQRCIHRLAKLRRSTGRGVPGLQFYSRTGRCRLRPGGSRSLPK